MQSIEPDRRIALKIWWAFTWRSWLLTMSLSILIGILLGFLSLLLGMTVATLDTLSARFGPLIGLLLYLLVSSEIMRRILKKKFKDFEIAIVPRQTQE